MKNQLFLVLFSLYSIHLFSYNKDSLSKATVDKKSQYLLITPGYLYITKNNTFFGEAVGLGVDYEYFFKNKFSVSNGLSYGYSYQKYALVVNDFEYNIAMRYYFKLRKRYCFHLYSSASTIYRNYNVLTNNNDDYLGLGFNSASGIGYHWVPIRKKKNALAHFGFHVNFNLLSFTSNRIKSPYSTIGLLYRIN